MRSTDGRNYPWGEKADPNRANYDATSIGGTSPVGAFPGGACPYGLLDMSGNVWEWTRSEGYKEYPYKPDDGREDLSRKDVSRPLRGGSFDDNEDPLRCAFRYWLGPDRRYGRYGFRVMVSPLLLSQL
ncbi:MAG: formylglycine-generating enzyme family protein [Anaerolineae bacterium]|nr:formylglycine-generating enzyme family protein [Anaerolineae bacterium]